MQKIKNVQVGEKIVVLKELRVKDILELKNHFADEVKLTALVTSGESLLKIVCNLTQEDMAELSFSELELLEKEFRELNAPLFRYYTRIWGQAVKVGAKEIVSKILEGLRENFMRRIETTPLQAVPEPEPKLANP